MYYDENNYLFSLISFWLVLFRIFVNKMSVEWI